MEGTLSAIKSILAMDLVTLFAPVEVDRRFAELCLGMVKIDRY